MDEKIVLWLWSNGTAMEQARFYTGLVPDSRIARTVRAPGDGPEEERAPLTVGIELAGRPIVLLNGGPGFPYNEAASLRIQCDDQAEVDRLWTAIVDEGGGEPSRCGWCKDRWGLSWQIVPRRLYELVSDPDPDRVRRATAAMLTMTKLDIAALDAAADGADA